MIRNSRKSARSVLNFDDKMVTAVSTAQNAVSIRTAWKRFTFSPPPAGSALTSTGQAS